MLFFLGSALVFSEEVRLGDVVLFSNPVVKFCNPSVQLFIKVMIKLKCSFEIGLEQKRKPVPRTSKTISKVLRVTKEIVRKRLLKS